MPAQQTYANHTRFHPPFHFIAFPLLLLNLGFSIYVTIHHWPEHHALFLWWIVMSVVLFVLLFLTRGYALKVQDRVICLEERLRLSALLSPVALERSHALTRPQLIALRFASDEELPALSERAVAEHLEPKDIKKSINKWRPDNYRV